MPVPQSRTQWAERQAEELLSVPFIAEFVLRSPQRIDGTQKEVADLLILYKDGNLLLSQKAQEDPLSRNQQKNELWVLKAAKNGVSQLCGATAVSFENPDRTMSTCTCEASAITRPTRNQIFTTGCTKAQCNRQPPLKHCERRSRDPHLPHPRAPPCGASSQYDRADLPLTGYPYSYRSATIGSTRAALLAGIQHASTPVVSKSKTVLAKVTGS